jgi:hypothetical protein
VVSAGDCRILPAAAVGFTLATRKRPCRRCWKRLASHAGEGWAVALGEVGGSAAKGAAALGEEAAPVAEVGGDVSCSGGGRVGFQGRPQR